MISDASHRTILKGIDIDATRRQSPTPSEPGETGGLRGMSRDSPIESPVLGVYPLFHSSTAPLATSPRSTRLGHGSRNSTDSVNSNAAIYGSGIPADTSQLLRSGMSIGEITGRRNGQDIDRRSPLDSGDRSATEPPGSGKDPRAHLFSFWNRKKKQKEDGSFPSPDDLDSPTIPGLSSKPHSLGSRVGHDSETSLDRPTSTFSLQEYGAALRASRIGRVFVLATANYWDYRMVDVTDVETSAELRQVICANLGMRDGDAQIFLTELGKSEHDEPLDDMTLITNKRLKADSVGTLKVFVRSVGPDAAYPTYFPPGTAVDAEAYARLNGQRQRSNSSPPTSRQGTVADGAEKEADDRLLPQEADAYRAEMACKQQEYLAKRRHAASKDHPSPGEGGTSSSSYGIIGRNVDFDQPRGSPYEEKRPELFPQRKAPAPPDDPSATLIKANSLSKKTGHAMKLSQGSPDSSPRPPSTAAGDSSDTADAPKWRATANPPPVSGGLDGALVSTGQGLGGSGQPSKGVPRGTSPSRPASSSAEERRFNHRGKDASCTLMSSSCSDPKLGGVGCAPRQACAQLRHLGLRQRTTLIVPDYSPGGMPAARFSMMMGNLALGLAPDGRNVLLMCIEQTQPCQDRLCRGRSRQGTTTRNQSCPSTLRPLMLADAETVPITMSRSRGLASPGARCPYSQSRTMRTRAMTLTTVSSPFPSPPVVGPVPRGRARRRVMTALRPTALESGSQT